MTLSFRAIFMQFLCRWPAVIVVLGALLLAYAAQAQSVRASWYHEGSHVACGGRFHPDGLTAAVPNLRRGIPCGTWLRVSYRGRSVRVQVNDKGPSERLHRGLDLSRGAAKRLPGFMRAGVARVSMQIVR